MSAASARALPRAAGTATRLAGAFLCVGSLAACAGEFVREDAPLRPMVRIENDGPWNDRVEAGHGKGMVGGPWEVVAEGFAWTQPKATTQPAPDAAARLAAYAEEQVTGVPSPLLSSSEQAAPVKPLVATPRRLSGPAVLPIPVARGNTRGAPTDAESELRFLHHPTHIAAARATVRVPAHLLARARLTGARVKTLDKGARSASGRARLELLELTVEGDEVTIRPLPPGEIGLRISARGDVAFSTRVGDQLTRESNLRILMVNDDAFIPLR